MSTDSVSTFTFKDHPHSKKSYAIIHIDKETLNINENESRDIADSMMGVFVNKLDEVYADKMRLQQIITASVPWL